MRGACAAREGLASEGRPRGRKGGKAAQSPPKSGKLCRQRPQRGSEHRAPAEPSPRAACGDGAGPGAPRPSGISTATSARTRRPLGREPQLQNRSRETVHFTVLRYLVCHFKENLFRVVFAAARETADVEMHHTHAPLHSRRDGAPGFRSIRTSGAGSPREASENGLLLRGHSCLQAAPTLQAPYRLSVRGAWREAVAHAPECVLWLPWAGLGGRDPESGQPWVRVSVRLCRSCRINSGPPRLSGRHSDDPLVPRARHGHPVRFTGGPGLWNIFWGGALPNLGQRERSWVGAHAGSQSLRQNPFLPLPPYFFVTWPEANGRGCAFPLREARTP